MKKGFVFLTAVSLFALAGCNHSIKGEKSIYETSTVTTTTKGEENNELNASTISYGMEEEITLPSHSYQYISLDIDYYGRYDIQITGDFEVLGDYPWVNGTKKDISLNKGLYKLCFKNDTNNEMNGKVSLLPSTNLEDITVDKEFLVRINTKKSLDKKLDIFFNEDVSFKIIDGIETTMNHFEYSQDGDYIDLLIRNETNAPVHNDLIVKEKEIMKLNLNEEHYINLDYDIEVFKLDLDAYKYYSVILKFCYLSFISNCYTSYSVDRIGQHEHAFYTFDKEILIGLAKDKDYSGTFIIEECKDIIYASISGTSLEPALFLNPGDTLYLDFMYDNAYLTGDDVSWQIYDKDKCIDLKYDYDLCKWELKVSKDAPTIDYGVLLCMFNKSVFSSRRIYVGVSEEMKNYILGLSR